MHQLWIRDWISVIFLTFYFNFLANFRYFRWFMNLHHQLHQTFYKLCVHCGEKYYTVPHNCPARIKNYKEKLKLKGEEVKMKKCPHCDVEYKTATQIKSHVRKFHTGIKPYECSLCSESFFEKIHRARHMYTKHSVGAKVFCQKCNKGYLQNYELVRHQSSCMKWRVLLDYAHFFWIFFFLNTALLKTIDVSRLIIEK